MKTLQTLSKAASLAFLLCVTLIPDLAPGAPQSGANNIVYVDNVIGDDVNPGTYEQPKATIQAGEDAAEALYGNDGIVVVWGGGSAYESVSITSSMKFYGNGRGLAGVDRGGLHAHAPMPVVSGEFYAIDLAAVTIEGFEITAGSGATEAIFLSNVGEATCSHNYFHDLSFWGIYNQTLGSVASTVRLEDNRFASHPNNGYCIIAGSYEASKLTLVASNNSIKDSPWAYPVTLLTRDTAEMDAVVDGNLVDEVTSSVALWASSEQDSVLKLKASDNQMTGGSGIRMESLGQSHQSAVVTDNVVEGTPNGAIMAYSSDDSTLDLVASRNSVYSDLSVGNFGAITASAFSTSEMTAVFADNEVNGIISASISEEGVLDFAATGNVVTGVPEFTGVPGIGVWGTYSAGVIHAAISGNHVRGVTGDGIVLQEDGATMMTVTDLGGNVINEAAANGIFVDLVNPDSSVTGTKNNVATGSGGNSLEVVNEPVNGQIKLNGAIISPLVDTP